MPKTNTKKKTISVTPKKAVGPAKKKETRAKASSSVATAKKVATPAAAKKAAARKPKVKEVTPVATKTVEVPKQSTRPLDENGFVIGSDSALIAWELLKGGTNRIEVNDRIAKALAGRTTRHGNEKNVTSLVSGLLTRLKDRGYTVEQTWRLVPPADRTVTVPDPAPQVQTPTKAKRPSTGRTGAKKTPVTKAKVKA